MPYEMPELLKEEPDYYLFTCKEMGVILREFKAKTLRGGNTWALDAYNGHGTGMGRTGTIYIYAIHVRGGKALLSLVPCQKHEVFLGKVEGKPAGFPIMDKEDLELDLQRSVVKERSKVTSGGRMGGRRAPNVRVQGDRVIQP